MHGVTFNPDEEVELLGVQADPVLKVTNSLKLSADDARSVYATTVGSHLIRTNDELSQLLVHRPPRTAQDYLRPVEPPVTRSEKWKPWK